MHTKTPLAILFALSLTNCSKSMDSVPSINPKLNAQTCEASQIQKDWLLRAVATHEKPNFVPSTQWKSFIDHFESGDELWFWENQTFQGYCIKRGSMIVACITTGVLID